MVKLPQKKLSLVVLAACLAVAAVFAGGFIFANLGHAHPGEPCSVCLQLEAAHSLLEGLGLAGLSCLVFGLVPWISSAKKRLWVSSVPQTLVGLKIKNNS